MKNCIFEPRTDISSATICKYCGQEKYLHINCTAPLISDVSKMVEDDVEKFALKYIDDEWSDADDTVRFGIEVGVKIGYNKAKETLYTEEQVIGFADWLNLNEYRYSRKYKCYQKILINETVFFTTKELFENYIQSLKQPKK